MKFSDLNFKETEFPKGIQARCFFPNGYGASIVKNEMSYGNEYDLYEIAVLKGNAEKWHITYDTPITEDVIGWCTPTEIERILNSIESLEED